MKKIETLHELLKHELKDLYSAETQIIDALPAMVEAASNADLKKALNQHLAITKQQKTRLDKIQHLLGDKKNAPETKGFFANLFKSSEGEEHCKAMEGLVKEGNSLLEEDMAPEVMDAAIIAASQKIEHYEISSYGTAKAYALQLKLSSVAALLEETLKEEYFADDSLTKLALSKVNIAAEPVNKKPAKKDNSTSPKKAAAKEAAPKKAKAPTPKKSAPKAAAKKKGKR